MSREHNINMRNNEIMWDDLIKVKTTGRDDSRSDQYRYPYEPTPYLVLERLANSGLLRKNDVLLDYGCGKGRVDFFLSYQTRAKTIGIEFFYYPSDEYISYLMAIEELEFMDEIDCRDLFDGDDQRERIMIFQILMYE